MKRALILGAVVSLGTFSAAVGAAQQGRGAQAVPTNAIQIEKVAANLFVLAGGGGNTAAFVTADGVVLVDTKIAGWGKPILDKLKEVTDKPVTTIINTHTHFDHVSGNVEFPATVEVVAQELTAQLMREMRPLPGVSNAPKENIFTANVGRGLPSRTFKDRLSIGSGGDRVDLYYFGRAHTSVDTFVVFPALRAMHTGDAFPNKGIPIVDPTNDGSALEYPDTVGKAAAVPNVDIVITGHHPTTLTIADLKVYADFNREFVEAVRAAKAQGRTVEEVASSWRVPQRFLEAGYTQPPPGTSGQGTARLRANIEVLWRELK